MLLRNDGHGGFDDVSGTAGLDLDQDGRSFAVFDYDGDGDPTSCCWRRAPRRSFASSATTSRAGHAALALRLTGTKSNRDAIGARVTVEDRPGAARRASLMAGSGFLSQHSKELLFGLGRSPRIAKVTITWPSGLVQTLPDVPIDHRVCVEEGKDAVRAEPFRKAGAAAPAAAAAAGAAAGSAPRPASGSTSPSRRPTSRCATSTDRSTRSGAAGPARARPLLGDVGAALASRRFRRWRASARRSRPRASPSSPSPSTRARTRPRSARPPRACGLPVRDRGRRGGGHLQRPPQLPVRPPRGPAPAHGVPGERARRDRQALPRAGRRRDRWSEDVAEHRRLPGRAPGSRRVPFPGNPYSSPGARNYFQYGLELSEQGFDVPALGAFERVAKARPERDHLLQPGHALHEGRPARRRPRRPSSARSSCCPSTTSPPTAWARCSRRSGDAAGRDRALPRGARGSSPDFADALNNLGYALFQTGQADQAFELYQKALAHRPDFAEALNNLGIYYGQGGDLERAEPRTSSRRWRPTRATARRATTSRSCSRRRGDSAGATLVLQRLIDADPGVRAGLRDARRASIYRPGAGATPSRCWSCCCRGTRRTRPRSRRCRSSAPEASARGSRVPPGLRPGSSPRRGRARRSAGSRGRGGGS